MFSHLYPESYTPFSSPHFPPIKRYQDSIFKLLTLSTNSVTNLRRLKICDRVCTQSKKLYEDILASLDQEKKGLENGV